MLEVGEESLSSFDAKERSDLTWMVREWSSDLVKIGEVQDVSILFKICMELISISC